MYETNMVVDDDVGAIIFIVANYRGLKVDWSSDEGVGACCKGYDQADWVAIHEMQFGFGQLALLMWYTLYTR